MLPLPFILSDYFMANAKPPQLSRSVSKTVEPSVQTKQQPVQQPIQSSKLPPPVVSTTTQPPKFVSLSDLKRPPPCHLSKHEDSDVELCDDFAELGTDSGADRGRKIGYASASSSASASLSAARALLRIGADPSLLRAALSKQSLSREHRWPQSNTAMGRLKFYIVVGQDQTPLIGGTNVNMCVPAQGTAINQRTGDTIWAHYSMVDVSCCYFPYNTAAVGQCNASADACAHACYCAVSTSYLPATAGTSDFGFGWSASNPPATSDGTLITMGTQGDQMGNFHFLNPYRQVDMKIHRYSFMPQLGTEHGDGNDMYNANVCTVTTTNSASIAGTQGVKIYRKRWFIPLNYKIVFSPGATTAVCNLPAFSFATNYTAANKRLGGFDCLMGYQIRTFFSDMNN